MLQSAPIVCSQIKTIDFTTNIGQTFIDSVNFSVEEMKVTTSLNFNVKPTASIYTSACISYKMFKISRPWNDSRWKWFKVKRIQHIQNYLIWYKNTPKKKDDLAKSWAFYDWAIKELMNRFKVGLSPSKKNLFDMLQWKPFKNDEKAFYFILKALFVLKIFKFLSRLVVHTEKKGLIRRLRLISNFMTSQPG